MSASCDWYEKDHIIGVQYAGDLNLDDLDTMLKHMLSLATSTTNNIDVIVDLTQLEKVSCSFHEIATNPHGLQITQLEHFGWTVYYGRKDNPLFAFLTHVIAETTKHKIYMAETREQALDFIRAMDTDQTRQST